MNAKQIIARIAQANETMQAFIEAGVGIETRERQERLINGLYARYAKLVSL
jgi:hypothetical protein